MTPNYLLAGQWEQQVHALALNESSGNPHPPPSDDGQAEGLLGQHPSFFAQWYGRGSFTASTADTWTDARIKAAASYLEHEVPLFGLDGAVQGYNEGIGYFAQGRRDPDYLAEFNDNLNKVREETNS